MKKRVGELDGLPIVVTNQENLVTDSEILLRKKEDKLIELLKRTDSNDLELITGESSSSQGSVIDTSDEGLYIYDYTISTDVSSMPDNQNAELEYDFIISYSKKNPDFFYVRSTDILADPSVAIREGSLYKVPIGSQVNVRYLYRDVSSGPNDLKFRFDHKLTLVYYTLGFKYEVTRSEFQGINLKGMKLRPDATGVAAQRIAEYIDEGSSTVLCRWAICGNNTSFDIVTELPIEVFYLKHDKQTGQDIKITIFTIVN